MSRPNESGQVVSDQVQSLANEIRDLKAALVKQGLSKDAINRNEEVLAKVAALQALKTQLSSDDPNRDEAILARLEEERRQRHAEEQVAAAAQRKELEVAEKAAPKPLVQRKIFHLFRYAGSGESFHYEPPPRFNAEQTGFGEGADPHPAIYVTEKWDGTTMQATSTHIFKRLDLWGKKKKADPSERYDLRLVAWRAEDGTWRGLDFADADARVSQALSPYLSKLEALEPGLCVYFEVVHTDINVTFKHLPGFADIRVFDFSRAPAASSQEARFLPFEETIRLAEQCGLPIVGWDHQPRADAGALWQQLSDAARGRHYASSPAQIEGYVIREAGAGGRIAKARVEQVQSTPSEVVPLAVSAGMGRKALTMRHLRSIGLHS
jgi:hypothetical protein